MIFIGDSTPTALSLSLILLFSYILLYKSQKSYNIYIAFYSLCFILVLNINIFVYSTVHCTGKSTKKIIMGCCFIKYE